MPEFEPAPIPPGARVYVAGHRGLAGSAITRALARRGHTDLITRASSELDLRDRDATLDFFHQERPEYVFLAAARVGGILANDTYPLDFISDNLRIQVNVIDAAVRAGARRLLFLGSSCIYPKFAEQPIREDSLMTGALEPTNSAYAVAKIAGIEQVRAARRQAGASFISAMPTNLYGPGDNFDLMNSHVLPALMRKAHEAKLTNAPALPVWGSGTPRREFLYADDLGDALVYLMEHYDSPDPINVGTGEDVTIRELAELVARTVGYAGELRFDPTKPDGTPRKLLDVTRLKSLGWQPATSLEDGVRRTYAWFLEHHADARGLAATAGA